MNKDKLEKLRINGIKRSAKKGIYSLAKTKYPKNSKKINRIFKEFLNRKKNGMSVQRIADINKISRSSIYRLFHKYKPTLTNLYTKNPNVKQFIFDYCGSKIKLIPNILKLMPTNFNTYFEPFVGSGVVFFYLQPKKAILNDLNYEIMNLYKEVKNHPLSLISRFEYYHTHMSYDYFNYLRYDFNNHSSNLHIKDAQFLALLNNSFNGLIRYKNGKYCGTFGHNRKRTLKRVIKSVKADSKYFKDNDTKFYSTDYKNVLPLTKSGDFVFLDPPYNHSSHYHYYVSFFSDQSQRELAQECLQLTAKHVKFLETNSDTPLIRYLYRNFKVTPVKREHGTRLTSNRSSQYGEVIITNY